MTIPRHDILLERGAPQDQLYEPCDGCHKDIGNDWAFKFKGGYYCDRCCVETQRCDQCSFVRCTCD